MVGSISYEKYELLQCSKLDRSLIYYVHNLFSVRSICYFTYYVCCILLSTYFNLYGYIYTNDTAIKYFSCLCASSSTLVKVQIQLKNDRL